jgi:hypothetical protein
MVYVMFIFYQNQYLKSIDSLKIFEKKEFKLIITAHINSFFSLDNSTDKNVMFPQILYDYFFIICCV